MNLNQSFNRRNYLPSNPNNMSKDSLNKYKIKKDKKQQDRNYSKDSNQRTSLNQFQKYFLDAINVFYQDRQQLKEFQKTKRKIYILLPVWFILVILYYFINSIKPFQGICPQNATCKVFVRCNPGFELSEDGRLCIVKSSIINQVQSLCKFQIQQLRLKYGDKDCEIKNQTFLSNQKSQKVISNAPFKRISQLIQSTTKDLQGQTLKFSIQKKLKQFLLNQSNQLQYEFNYIDPLIVPTSKKYSFGCWLSLVSQTVEFKIVIIVGILAVVLGIWFSIKILKQKKIQQIYNYLKQKVLLEGRVNVTLLGDQIKSRYGTLNEEIWVQIDKQRKKDGKIGYYQDEFLYWKLI